MIFKKYILTPLLTLFSAILAAAEPASPLPPEESRPIRSSYSLAIGRQHTLDTYLSPLTYHGLAVRLDGSWRKRMPFSPRKWEMVFRGSLETDATSNPAGNAHIVSFFSRFAWGMGRVWEPAPEWQLTAGAQAALDGGILYLSRNSNNPVAVKASAGIDLWLRASRDLKLRSLPATIFWEAQLPTLSAFFSPQYGETYYEIYLGNHSGLAHCGWWGNHFGFDSLLGAELHFGRRSLLLGWSYRLRSEWVNNLNTSIFSHSAVVGLSF